MSMVGRMMAKTVLGARASKLSWPYLWQSVVTARNEFLRLTMDETEETACVRHKEASILNMFVNLALEMREIANRLKSVRDGKSSHSPMPNEYVADAALNLVDARI